MKITFITLGVSILGFLLPELLVVFKRVRSVQVAWNLAVSMAFALVCVGVML